MCTGRVQSFNHQEISNCLLSFAKMEHVDVSLLQVSALLWPFDITHTP